MSDYFTKDLSDDICDVPGLHYILKGANGDRAIIRQFLKLLLENVLLSVRQYNLLASWLTSNDQIFDVCTSLYSITLDLQESLKNSFVPSF